LKAVIRAAWIAAVSLFASNARGADTDVVHFDQNKLVGEVKYLERGKLHFKTPATDTITVEWTHVARLESPQRMRIELSNGRRYLAYLSPSDEQRAITLTTDAWEGSIALTEIVAMTPIEDTLRDRWDLTVSAGYNYTKSSEIEQLNFGFDTEYESRNRRFDLFADYRSDTDSSGVSNDRLNINSRLLTLRADNWFTGYQAQLERNDALGIDLRASIGYGAGRFLVRSNQTNVLLFGGLGVTREWTGDDTNNENNIEAIGTAQWELFKYDDPEVDVSTTFSLLPSLSDFGRVRSNLDITVAWELMDDVDWQLSFYGTYDSDPLVPDTPRTDYGVVTGVAVDL
jgi:hypothetical protein